MKKFTKFNIKIIELTRNRQVTLLCSMIIILLSSLCFDPTTAQSEGKGSSSQRLVSSLSTLYLISKIKPQHLVKHAMTLQPYLSTKCSVSTRIVMG